MPIVRNTSAGLRLVNVNALQEQIFGREIPDTEQYRRYYGRALTPFAIEQVIRAADDGYMRDLTDLEYEVMRVDGHLGACAGKRFRRIAASEYDVVPASGAGLDPARAKARADEVRQQIAAIRGFRRALVQLAWAHCHGRAALEKQWRYVPGAPVRWQIASLDWIHPRRLSFGPERELRVRDDMWAGLGFDARGYDLRQYPFKWIPFTPQLFNDYPEREGFGPHTLYWSFFKRFGQRERMILTEVFGKPWRLIGVDPESDIVPQKEQLDLAQVQVDKLGANASCVLPPGIQVVTEQPHPESGQSHRDIIQDANDEISKIVLGQTRTTDAKPNAIGSSGDEVAQDAEDLIVASDGWGISEILTEELARDIVVLNHGEDELPYVPSIRILTAAPANRDELVSLTQKTLAMGIPLRVADVYERTGFDPPGPDDRVVQVVHYGDGDRAAIGTGDLQPGSTPERPTDAPEPDPGVDPDGDGEPGEPPSMESARGLAEKMTAAGVTRCEHGSSNRCRLCGIERVRDFEMGEDGQPQWKVAWRPIA